jgi:hypothetical protein
MSRSLDRSARVTGLVLLAVAALSLGSIAVSTDPPGKATGTGDLDTGAAEPEPETAETAAVPRSSRPTANHDIAETIEGAAVRIDVAANDTDPDGDLVPESTSTDCDDCSAPLAGTVTSRGDGTVTYTPAEEFSGFDQFVYRICDAEQQCADGTVTVTVMAEPPPRDPSTMPDAFSEASYWNTPIPDDAAVHPDSERIIEFLREDNAEDGCILLSGYEGNDWGMPAYAAGTDDPVYSVVSRKYELPPEFASLRIPLGALPADSSDGEMVVYDLVSRVVALLSKAVYDADTDTWTVNGGSIAHLDSNGLDGSLPAADDVRNRGTFRGYPGAVAMVHQDDIAAGELDNVVKIGVNNAREGFVFPMVGSDGDTDDPDAPVEGTRIRIKPDVDLEELGLSDQALIIARGLQKYGMVVADNTGGGIELKLEDTERSGRGPFWELEHDSLCAITTDHLEVVAP